MPPTALSKREFVALLAFLTMVDALSGDIMLPGLPAMGAAYAVANPNDRSLVLMIFALGFGLTQPLFGPLADRFGRRLPILAGMGLYVACSFAETIMPTFAALLAVRFIHGAAASAVKVAVTAAIRDRYEGQAMAQVTSLILSIFLLVPVIMPSVGQLLLLAGPWQLIFVAMGGVAIIIGLWAWLRLGETLPAGSERPLSFAGIADGFAIVLGNRTAFFYGATGMFLTGAVLAMIFTSQQVYAEHYGWGVWYPLAMAAMGGSASLASLAASRFLSRVSLRRAAHTALLGLSLLTFPGAAFALVDALPAWGYLLIACLVAGPLVTGFASTGALSMQPLGEVAGTAASVFGLLGSVGGTAISYAIAQSYNGTPVPTLTGMGIMGLCGLGCCLIAENGKLFGGDQPVPVPPLDPV